MINQNQLMSHISVHQCKIDRYELGTTSKYISNYIEQRKALILAKLARNSHQQDRDTNEGIELQNNTCFSKVYKGSFKQERKTQTRRKTSELSEFQKPNKNNKNDEFHRFTDPGKFLARSSMYQKQKQLNFQFQKRKNLYTQASAHKFQPALPKKDDSTQSKIIEKKTQKQQQTYQQKHDKKLSKNWDDQRINYKDLMKQSMTKFNQQKQQSTTTKDEKERWKQIQQFFQKVKPNIVTHEKKNKVEKNHNKKDDIEKDLSQDQLNRLEINQVKLSLKKVESQEQNVKKFVQNLEIQRHFEEDLSGIMIDDDLKEEVDSSHVFQQVVNEMMLESEEIQPDITEQKIAEEAQIIKCISILDSSPENKDEQDPGAHHYHQLVQVGEDEWITNENKGDFSQEHIVIKKVQSQIIENSQIQQNNQSAKLIQSKVQVMAQHHSISENSNLVNQSLIDMLSDKIVGQAQKESIIIENPQKQACQRQKQSLETLANQFILLSTNTKASDDNEDLDIPDEESPNINIEFFDFTTVSHQFTAHILSNVMHLPDSVADQMQPQILLNNDFGQQQNEETIEQIEEQLEILYEEPRVCNITRTLRSFGEFLVIPEESEEESRQSIG